MQLVTLVLPFVILIGLLAWHFRRFPLSVSINQPPPRAGQRAWRVAAYVVWSLGFVTMATHVQLWTYYQQTKPRIAQPAIGRVYPEYVRGATVYLTKAEHTRLEFWSDASFIFITAAFVVFAVVNRQQEGINERRYTRPHR